MDKLYDIAIIGAGPAGLSAGIYAGRARLSALIIEQAQEGGQITATAQIENYPGGEAGETGMALAKRMAEQARSFGAEFAWDTIAGASLAGEVKRLRGGMGEYAAKTVILAGGTQPRRLGCPGEKEFTGRGVSYCATCDGRFFRERDIYVVGGGDSAASEALYLARFGRKVTIIHRRDALRAVKSLQEQVLANPKLRVLWDSEVEALGGEGMLQRITVRNIKTGARTTFAAQEPGEAIGLFCFVGMDPQTAPYVGEVQMERGYILADADMRTNIPGVFAAGDIRKKSLRQVVTAVADGAIAAVQAEKYLSES
ncbi:MAG: thioredoxin-disulfide reductase [Christensenellaceae bacterium]|jgi:thioredoxin reductase (NADPH)|nr:thioredoxin-disulfide reductase [Christensenellaceae bacterium]